MLGFNCGYSCCSKFSLVQFLSPCRREIQETDSAFHLFHKFYCCVSTFDLGLDGLFILTLFIKPVSIYCHIME